MSKPNIMICAPTNITEIERKAIIQAAEQSGGGKVYLEYEPKVAAIGAGLDIFKPRGSMVIDMGGGTSDIAILSLGDIVSSSSVRLAGDKLNSDIAAYIKDKHGLVIGEHTAENIKMKLGTALKVDKPEEMDVRGRDVATGMPKQVTVNENEIEEAIHDTLDQILTATVNVLETIPPELASDIIDRGIVLTGGTALLKNIDKLFSDRLKVPVMVSQSPLDNVAKGAGEMLERMQKTEGKKK
jgi:rod shape-determining protein MreB